jgi:type IV pilus assembly protein PilF
MRPESRLASILTSLALVAALAGCSRVTFLRPDASRGDFHRTAPEVQIRTDGGPRAAAFNLVQVARARLLSGDADAALETAQRAVRIDARHADAHSLVGLSLDALGRGAQSGAHHRRAAELAPSEGALLNNYGIWLCGNGRAAESLAWFDRALAAPGYATPDAALANAGTCALRAGDAERARASLRRAVELKPDNALALRSLAEAELRLGRAFEARAFIERRLAAAPADEESLLLASQIEHRLGDTAAAARYVQRIRAEFPRTPDSAPEGGNR